MNKNPHCCTRILLLFLFILLGLTSTQAFALYKEEEEKPTPSVSSQTPLRVPQEDKHKPQYAPGEIIIKFNDTAGLILDRKLSTKTLELPLSQTGFVSLDTLNQKHKVKHMEPVFKALKTKQLQSGKSHTELSEETQKEFPTRSKRIPKNAELPNLSNIYKLELEDKNTNLLQVIEEYKKDPNVEYAEPNYVVEVQSLPNDTYVDPDQDGNWSTGAWGQSYPDMWGLKRIKANLAWDIERGQTNRVTVAVVDTGVDTLARLDPSTDDISANFTSNYPGYDFVNNDGDPYDDYGHGSHVAGTIAAVSNNGKGIAGVSWMAKIIAVKAIDRFGQGTEVNLANAISYAVTNGADIINMSWGGAGESRLINDALDNAYAAGLVLVAAAGNSNGSISDFFPANNGHVLCVAAWSYDNTRASFSNFGPEVDVAAPGVDILSWRSNLTSMGTPLNNYYTRASGTSMAAPHVAGVAALLLSHYPTLSSNLVELIIQMSAEDVLATGKDDQSGYGVLDSYNALLLANAWVNHPTPELLISNNKVKALSSQQGEISFEIVNAGFLAASNVLYRVYSGDPSLGKIIREDSISSLEADTRQAINFNYSLVNYLDDFVTIKVDPDNQIPEFSEANNEIKTTVTLLLPGWPQRLGSRAGSSTPAIGDIDGDGSPEIAVGSGSFDNAIYAFHANGSLVAGWPLRTGTDINGTNYYVSGSPSIVDLNGDGKPEVVVAAANGMYIWRQSLTNPNLWENYPGWPIIIPDPLCPQTCFMRFDNFTVADLDGDNFPEIVALDYKGNVYAWHQNGTLLWQRRLDSWALATSGIATADLENDGQMEIIITSTQEKRVYVWQSNGNPKPGLWPQTTGDNLNAAPAIADIDGDQIKEIIVVSRDGKSYAWHLDGSAVAGWPKTIISNLLFNSSPVIGDLNGDGIPEIVVGSYSPDNKVYAIDIDGHAVNGWPQQVGGRVEASPALVDIDGDKKLEVVVGTMDPEGKVYMWHADGSLVKGWPQKTGLAPNLTPSVAVSVAIADIDGNGTPEVVGLGNADANVYVWAVLGATSADPQAWPMYRRNLNRTGEYPLSNHAPVLNHIGDKTIDEGLTLSFSVSASDIEGNPLVYTVDPLPPGATFDATNRTFSWTPIFDQSGSYNATFSVSDGSLVDSEAITITVNNVNRAPVLNLIDNKSINEGRTLTFQISATDPDNAPLTYSASGLPTGANFDPATHTFAWTPTYDQAGSYNVTFTVSDGSLTASETITITVNNVNRAPTLASIGNKSVYVGSTLSFQLSASDPDNDTLTYSVVSLNPLPSGATFGSSGTFSWKPASTQVGTYSFTFRVDDGHGGSNSQAITITVKKSGIRLFDP